MTDLHTRRVGSADPTIALLLQEAPLAPSDRVLILNGADPALPIGVAQTAAEVVVYMGSASALRRIQGPIAARHLSNVILSDAVFPEVSADNLFNAALMPLPKGREHVRGLLWSARRALRPGGSLYIAGPGDGGIKSALADAATLFGAAVTLTTRQRCRIGVAEQPAALLPRYPAEWGDDPTLMQQRIIAGLPLWTMPGVFSWQGLDEGTAFLLECLSIAAGARVLDVGCGYGVIGLTTAARGAGEVIMTDDSLLAAGCAAASVETSGFANVSVVAADLFDGLESKQKFDLIVSNPPFHQGFEADTNVARRLIIESGTWLAPGGRLVIVANVFLRYDRLMRESFSRVRTVAENSRYAVWEAKA